MDVQHVHVDVLFETLKSVSLKIFNLNIHVPSEGGHYVVFRVWDNLSLFFWITFQVF